MSHYSALLLCESGSHITRRRWHLESPQQRTDVVVVDENGSGLRDVLYLEQRQRGERSKAGRFGTWHLAHREARRTTRKINY